MATVYLAADLRHDRRVAIKVLKPELAAALGPDRFLREITLTARLDHPHILPLLDSGEVQGFLYYVMPYVEGESLRDRLNREKQLPLEDALQIAREVADGLSYAHSHDVVHRDIKPENILLAGGHARVADFGIARAVTAAGADKLTETGLAIGTPAYMSPEQAAGDRALDARSDVYSLGCVVYEMLAGEPPFTGATADAILARKSLDAVPSLRVVRQTVPEELEDAITKALAKVPADRFATAREFADLLKHRAATAPAVPRGGPRGRRTLRFAAAVLTLATGLGLSWWGVKKFGGRTPPIRSLAVLPLANLMGDPEQEYFVAGMHEALIAELGQIGALVVISRTSVMRYQNTEKSVPEIGRELKVDALVEGSMFKAGDSVRVRVQLIRAAPVERQLWSRTYDGDLRNVLALQKRVARAIAEQIQVTVTPQEAARLATARSVDPAAYDAWARGWFQFTRLTEVSLRKCIEYADAALEIDSTYAPAYALTASCWNILPHIAPVASEEAFPKALAASDRALELDESLADAHFERAWTLAAYNWDWAGAEPAYRRGLQLNPGSAFGHSRFGWFLSWLGRDEEALAEASRAVELNPAGANEIERLAAVHYVGRRYDAAITAARRAIDIAPGFSWGYNRLGIAYTETGKYAEAIAALETAVKVSGGNHRGGLGRAYALAGRRSEARRILDDFLSLDRRSHVGSQIATIYAALGEKDEALRWLEEGYRVRNGNMVLLKVWPAWDPLRSDPRFQDLLRRMNFPD
jgi:serine/threonine-protein kinase